MPSIWAPSSIARDLCSTSPVTLAVFSSTTWSALISPFTRPQTRTVSAESAPCFSFHEATSDVAERWDGIHETASAELQRTDGFDEAAGERAAAGALKSGELPDAFVCANDELALGLMARLQKEGIDVPGDVMVTGWDDVMAARYAGLTTVRQPMRELGGTAARLLDELIAGSRDTPRHELLKTELVARSSTLGKETE